MSIYTVKGRPDYVYKYCSAARAIQVISDLRFYFTPSEKLNDLFEFNALSLFQEDDDSKYRVSAKRLLKEGWFDNFDEALDAAKSALSAEDVDSAYSFFLEQFRPKLALVRRYSGVSCFSSERNNQRMWGTYGDNHAGAVLEFSASVALSRFAKHLMPVIYADSKLPLCPSELMTREGILDQRLLILLLCVKHLHWREESEWRLLLLADEPQNDADRKTPFERAALTRVFVGPRISRDDEQTLRRAAEKLSPELPVFKRQIDDQFAREELVGVEEVHSLDQLLYWADRKGHQ